MQFSNEFKEIKVVSVGAWCWSSHKAIEGYAIVILSLKCNALLWFNGINLQYGGGVHIWHRSRKGNLST